MLNIDFFPSELLSECLVCVICNSKSIHSDIFKLYIMMVYTLKMCTFYFMHISRIFFSFLGCQELRLFYVKIFRWFLVCAICNASSSYSFIFKLCIMIEHVYTLYLSTFDNNFLSVQLRNCYVTYCRLHCEIWM